MLAWVRPNEIGSGGGRRARTRDTGTVDTTRKVLVIDDDAAITDAVQEILTEDGYEVTVLRDRTPGVLQAVVAQLEPDCLLLDGAAPGGYGQSWQDASWLAAGEPSVPSSCSAPTPQLSGKPRSTPAPRAKRPGSRP
jgi:hypothetical protein